MANLRRFHRNSQPETYERDDTFWALNDVSFEVKRGEVVGIIGRNGAGKSTLLKILSRITEPTRGKAELHGRVGSLLEVGTGFHPELTGRENIYLSGAVLGMSRFEINRQFDEIVSFSGVTKFIDTPVKRYSSGMNVRLGFAVAAHLEPEILLVDEVLAVGDAAFQQKCLGKMGDVANSGRTVLFVSHNMAAVANLCTSAILLEQGEITFNGQTNSVVEAYLGRGQRVEYQDLRKAPRREGNGIFFFSNLQIMNQDKRLIEQPRSGQEITIELIYDSKEDLAGRSIIMSLGFYSLMGQPLFLCRSDFSGTDFQFLPKKGSVFCHIPRFPLPAGDFRINLQCKIDGIIVDWIEDARVLSVAEGDFYGTGRLPSRKRGDVLVNHDWLSPTEFSHFNNQKV
jgi:lipopolysaccharide transport system ATP-binding protein